MTTSTQRSTKPPSRTQAARVLIVALGEALPGNEVDARVSHATGLALSTSKGLRMQFKRLKRKGLPVELWGWPVG